MRKSEAPRPRALFVTATEKSNMRKKMKERRGMKMKKMWGEKKICTTTFAPTHANMLKDCFQTTSGNSFNVELLFRTEAQYLSARSILKGRT